MRRLIAVALAVALAAPAVIAPVWAAAEPVNDPDNTLPPVDVPGDQLTYPGIEMVRPDRDPDKITCRYESQPDTRFKKRNCAQRHDRDDLERREHEYLMVFQRGFCGGGEVC